MEIQKFLPASTFIPFQAKRLKKASVVYADLDLFHQYNYFNDFTIDDHSFHQALLDEFAYIVPTTNEDLALVDETEKEFLAERYGGVGILSNGGGGRCGLIGPFQLKGIGPTPVVGEGVNYWYGHGGLALQDALTELIYGETACDALPYPSSRVLAVIDTGSHILRRSFKNRVNDTEDEKILVRGGLLLRESRIRPAHFARAFYFKPSPYVKENYLHDFKRVEETIPLLPVLTGNVDLTLNKTQQYIQAIEHISTRAALQLSYAKVRRFMHGSLTLSNFLIDGGWVDFGSVTVVPAYEQLITASLQPPFWEEFNLFRKTIADLCFYVGKFQPDSRVVVGMTNEMFQQFVDIYLKQLRLLFVESAGFPLLFGRHLLNSAHYDRLGSILLHIAHDENPIANVSGWVLHCSPPAHSWKNKSLRSVLQSLFFSYWVKRQPDAPKLPFKEHIVNDLWDSYCRISLAIAEIAQSENVSYPSLVQFIGFNTTRQLFGFKQLYRGQLLQVTDKIIEGSDSPEALYNNTNRLCSEYWALSKLLYNTPIGTELIIARNAENVCLSWNLIAGQYRLEIPENIADLMCQTAGINNLSLLVDAQSFPLMLNNETKNYSISFGAPGDEWLHKLNSVLIKADLTISLLSLFPHNLDLYEAYKATFAGLLPPAEKAEYLFKVNN
jgi:hypothetical protein